MCVAISSSYQKYLRIQIKHRLGNKNQLSLWENRRIAIQKQNGLKTKGNIFIYTNDFEKMKHIENSDTKAIKWNTTRVCSEF